MKYLLDTHVWVWWNMHPANLSRKVKGLIAASQKYEELLLSAISVWEFCKLLEKRRIGISCDPGDWLEAALATPVLVAPQPQTTAALGAAILAARQYRGIGTRK